MAKQGAQRARARRAAADHIWQITCGAGRTAVDLGIAADTSLECNLHLVLMVEQTRDHCRDVDGHPTISFGEDVPPVRWARRARPAPTSSATSTPAGVRRRRSNEATGRAVALDGGARSAPGDGLRALWAVQGCGGGAAKPLVLALRLGLREGGGGYVHVRLRAGGGMKHLVAPVLVAMVLGVLVQMATSAGEDRGMSGGSRATRRRHRGRSSRTPASSRAARNAAMP
jgi:hypothetical protein